MMNPLSAARICLIAFITFASSGCDLSSSAADPANGDPNEPPIESPAEAWYGTYSGSIILTDDVTRQDSTKNPATLIVEEILIEGIQVVRFTGPSIVTLCRKSALTTATADCIYDNGTILSIVGLVRTDDKITGIARYRVIKPGGDTLPAAAETYLVIR